MQLQIAPLSRTPMDKKSGRGMESYFKSVSKNIDNLSPWSKRLRYERRRAALKKQGVKSGEIVVMGNSLMGDNNNPIYKDAKLV